MKRLLLMIALIAILFLIASCMTPRQSEAGLVLQDLYVSGLITKEQLDALMAALSPSTWVSDVIAIGSGLIGGTGAYVATNVRRNYMRRARGEPVKLTDAEAEEAPATT